MGEPRQSLDIQRCGETGQTARMCVGERFDVSTTLREGFPLVRALVRRTHHVGRRRRRAARRTRRRSGDLRLGSGTGLDQSREVDALLVDHQGLPGVHQDRCRHGRSGHTHAPALDGKGKTPALIIAID